MRLEWLLLLSYALFFAMLAALPNIYSFMRDGKHWVPVNAPPYDISDDHHYYSLLNLIHRRFLNAFSGTNLDVIPLSVPVKLQIVGFLFNIVPYHIGYLLHDRRLGVLFVRIWNTSWLMLALMVHAKLLFGALRLEASPILLTFTASVFFLTYPMLVWSGTCNSIWRNLSKKDHIFLNAEANDLQRAMHMATTGHLFLWASVLLFWCFGQGSLNEFFYLIPSVAGLLLFFAYFPVAVVYGFCYLAGLVVENQFLAAGGWLVICMVLTTVYLRVLFKDAVGKEVFVHTDSNRRIFAFNRASLGGVAITLLLPLVSFVLLKDAVTTPIFWVMFFGTGAFAVTTLAVSHQGGRFWMRGAVVVYELFVVVTSIVLFERYVSCCGKWIMVAALFLLVLALAFYFFRNAVFLFDTRSTRSQNWIDVQQLCSNRHGGSKLIATDSVEIGFYIYLYTGNSCLLKHYSIQDQGYKKNLEEFCLNFKVSGYELSEVLNIFSRHVEYSDWLSKRMEAAHDSYVAGLVRIHTLQFMATYREFNQRILDDGMFDKNGWTNRAKELISTIWQLIETQTVPSVTVITNPDGGLHAASKAPRPLFNVETCKNNLNRNFIIFDDLLRRYGNDSCIHKILLLLRLPYSVTSEIYNMQRIWTKQHDRQCYVHGIKKLTGLIFLKRKLSGGGDVALLEASSEGEGTSEHFGKKHVQILRSHSFAYSNILLYKKIISVLLALSSAGCLRNRGYLIDEVIEAVLLYDQLDLSGIDMATSPDVVDYYATIVQKAVEQGIKTIRIEYYFHYLNM